MSIAYTNRLGTQVYLHKRMTKSGSTRFVFARELDAVDAVDEIPDGYEIHESVHGRVTLRKPPRRYITELEELLVQRGLRTEPYLRRCRYELKGKLLEIFEPGAPTLNQNYEAVMRFELLDANTRSFRVDRMCYKSWKDGWMEVGRGPLAQLASSYLPHVTRSSFYELWDGDPLPPVGGPGTRF